VKTAGRWLCCSLMFLAVAACDSVELTIAVAPGAPGTLDVANATDTIWIDARLTVEVVESDNSATPCAEQSATIWRPGETISIPSCGRKIRLVLSTGGQTSRFTYVNGRLFRVFGRKEVPVAS
jgi:hypothetical protein